MKPVFGYTIFWTTPFHQTLPLHATSFRLLKQSFSTMSWMDSWSRPNKQSATPPPLYLTSDDVKYCVACGRVIGDRKSHQKNEVVKYCSAGCRKRRLSPLDKRIDSTILALLLGQQDSGIENIDVKSRFRKGDRRNIIFCDEIENIVFKRDAEETSNAKVDTDEEDDPYRTPDEEANDSQGNRPNPPGSGSDEKRQKGQRKAEEREMVRRAARRAVVFGFSPDKFETTNSKGSGDGSGASPRKCEAIMNGQIVEPSFAKGNWAVRWRE